MNKRTKLAVGIGLCLLCAGLLILNALAYNQARAMTRFTQGGVRTSKPERLAGFRKLGVLLSGVNIPRPAAGGAPSSIDPQCRAFTIPGPDGTTLALWYCNRGEDTPLVILFHGYVCDKSSLAEEARAFLELGASVLLADFRGSGGSSEAYTTVGFLEADDVASVARYARKELRHSKLLFFGQSMGAAAVLRAICQGGVSPDAVIIEAVFDTMLATVRNRFRSMRVPSFPSAELLVLWGGWQFGFNAFRHNPVKYAAALRCQALFMHGTDDPRATLAEGRRVFDAVPGGKRLQTFDGVGHQSYVTAHRDQWKAAVGGFMEEAGVRMAKGAAAKP